MKLTHHRITRNFFAWREGTYTLDVEFRGSKEDLQKRLKELLEEDLKSA